MIRPLSVAVASGHAPRLRGARIETLCSSPEKSGRYDDTLPGYGERGLKRLRLADAVAIDVTRSPVTGSED